MSVYYGDEPKNAKEGDIWVTSPRPMPIEVIKVPIDRRIYNALIKGLSK